MNALSPTVNHPEQPTVCYLCGKKIRKGDQNAQWYYDDTPARQHRSRHNVC